MSLSDRKAGGNETAATGGTADDGEEKDSDGGDTLDTSGLGQYCISVVVNLT